MHSHVWGSPCAKFFCFCSVFLFFQFARHNMWGVNQRKVYPCIIEANIQLPCAKFDDDDFNSFQGITYGGTHTHTHTETVTHTHRLGVIYVQKKISHLPLSLVRDLILIFYFYEFKLLIIFLLVDELLSLYNISDLWWMHASLIIFCMCVYLLGVLFLLCVICHLSVFFACLGVVVFYLRTCNLLINVLINCPNIITIVILTLFINQSMCAKRKISTFWIELNWKRERMTFTIKKKLIHEQNMISQ